MKLISDYVIEEMSTTDNQFCREGKIWIGAHELLNKSYLNYLEDNPKKENPGLYSRIQFAWNSVTRDDRFEKTLRTIKSVLFSERETKHRVYKLKEEVE